MRILITIDWFLPGTAAGGPVRSIANLIDHLNQDFEFYVVTRDSDYQSSDPYPGIQSNVWLDFNEYTKVYYLSADRLNKEALTKVFNSQDFDLAYITGIYSWYFSILPVRLLKPLNIPILISARGMLNPQAFSVKPLKKRLFIEVARILGYYKGVQFHATNQDEALHIKQQLGRHTKVQIAANLPRKVKLGRARQLKEVPRKWVSVARISKEKGTMHLLESLFLVSTPLELDLYGPIYDEDYWEKCKELIKQLPEYVVVTHKGSIPGEEIPEILAHYDFFVLLSEGENFGHAIFEAFSQGLPVLISDQTPWKSLSIKKIGWDLDIEGKAHIARTIDYANKMSSNDYAIWSRNCIDFAQSFSNDPKLIKQNKALFLHC